MIAHLVGNGPSKGYFLSNPPLEGDIFGCNFGSPDISFKAVFIHDSKPFRHLLAHKLSFDWPIIFRGCYVDYVNACIQHGLLKPSLAEKSMALSPLIVERSSGHDGLHYLILNEAYDEIHLWGFDSLISGVITTDSVGKIDNSNPQVSRLPLWLNDFAGLFKKARERNKDVFLHHSPNLVTLES